MEPHSVYPFLPGFSQLIFFETVHVVARVGGLSYH